MIIRLYINILNGGILFIKINNLDLKFIIII